jgi:hypothetical protein
LAPDSPIFPVLNKASRAPWVRYHNIVGVLDTQSLSQSIVTRLTGRGDGVVNYDSARWEQAESELVVNADHLSVHRNPKAILEVRQILLDHEEQTRLAWQQRGLLSHQPLQQPHGHAVQPAGHTAAINPTTRTVPVPPQPMEQRWDPPRPALEPLRLLPTAN